jgi:Iron-sulfur cluster assembly protein
LVGLIWSADCRSASLGGPPAGAAGATTVPGSALSAEELEQLTADIVAALKTVYDPEIPADIYELGLIYKIDIDDDRNVAIVMTLTAPGCPVGAETQRGVGPWHTLAAGRSIPDPTVRRR